MILGDTKALPGGSTVIADMGGSPTGGGGGGTIPDTNTQSLTSRRLGVLVGYKAVGDKKKAVYAAPQCVTSSSSSKRVVAGGCVCPNASTEVPENYILNVPGSGDDCFDFVGDHSLKYVGLDAGKCVWEETDAPQWRLENDGTQTTLSLTGDGGTWTGPGVYSGPLRMVYNNNGTCSWPTTIIVYPSPDPVLGDCGNVGIKRPGVLVGWKNNKPIYAAGPCNTTGSSSEQTKGIPVGTRHPAWLIGYKQGKAVYGVDCCGPLGSSSCSSRSSSRSSSSSRSLSSSRSSSLSPSSSSSGSSSSRSGSSSSRSGSSSCSSSSPSSAVSAESLTSSPSPSSSSPSSSSSCSSRSSSSSPSPSASASSSLRSSSVASSETSATSSSATSGSGSQGSQASGSRSAASARSASDSSVSMSDILGSIGSRSSQSRSASSDSRTCHTICDCPCPPDTLLSIISVTGCADFDGLAMSWVWNGTGYDGTEPGGSFGTIRPDPGGGCVLDFVLINHLSERRCSGQAKTNDGTFVITNCDTLTGSATGSLGGLGCLPPCGGLVWTLTISV